MSTCPSSPYTMFQSTHSRGVRPALTMDEARALLFQSTHSRGVRRRFGRVAYNSMEVSIHALTRSATVYSCLSSLALPSFNPRTHEECDYFFVSRFEVETGFNPRTHEECDP